LNRQPPVVVEPSRVFNTSAGGRYQLTPWHVTDRLIATMKYRVVGLYEVKPEDKH
jgi:hypothetical protein